MTPHIPDKAIIFEVTRANYEFLLKAGVKIYEYTPGFLHAKSFAVMTGMGPWFH
jgi:cardiolipin synthase